MQRKIFKALLVFFSSMFWPPFEFKSCPMRVITPKNNSEEERPLDTYSWQLMRKRPWGSVVKRASVGSLSSWAPVLNVTWWSKAAMTVKADPDNDVEEVWAENDFCSNYIDCQGNFRILEHVKIYPAMQWWSKAAMTEKADGWGRGWKFELKMTFDR